MSLNEIRGTPLGAKMGVKPQGYTNKVVVPRVLQSPVASALVSTLVKKTTVNPKAVTKQLTVKQKEAITQAANLKFSQAVVSTPANQKMISTLRTLSTVATLKKSGLEITPKGTGALLYTAQEQAAYYRDAVSTLMTQQEQWTGKQKQYLDVISQNESILAKATNELGITKGQLTQTTQEYLTLQEKYNQLLQNPPSSPPSGDLFGGIGDFINKYGLWIALGIGAIILIPSLSNIIGGRK